MEVPVNEDVGVFAAIVVLRMYDRPTETPDHNCISHKFEMAIGTTMGAVHRSLSTSASVCLMTMIQELPSPGVLRDVSDLVEIMAA